MTASVLGLPIGPGAVPASPGGPVAAVDDVFVAFDAPAGPVMALRGLTLELAPGERLLIRGPNGSGKSTLLRVITGEQPITAGTVVVAGAELGGMSAVARRRWRARHVGIVDQHARRTLLPEWDVRDNVALQLRLAGLSAAAARRAAVGALDRFGLGMLARRAVGSLSGGEAQRVAICAALAHRPTLILADEPTGELDEAAAAQVYQLLAEAGREPAASLILVSHDRRAAAVADRAVRIRDGRTAEQWVPGPVGAATDEQQVVDAGGWVRLPTPLLLDGRGRTVGATGGSGGAIILRPGRLPGLSAPDEISPAVRPGGREPMATPVARLPLGPPGPLLARLDGVAVTYGERTVLAGFDLDVRSGELVALRGPSGSGKSTVLALAAGLMDPDSGRVELSGTEVGPLTRAQRADLRSSSQAVVLQHTVLTESLTVRENLALAAGLRPAADPDTGPEVTDWSAALRLTRLLDQPVRLCSGGERQRVSLARALISGAPLLILDEPTSQQDESSAALVTGVIADQVSRGRSVLAASHDRTFLALATRVVDLRRL